MAVVRSLKGAAVAGVLNAANIVAPLAGALVGLAEAAMPRRPPSAGIGAAQRSDDLAVGGGEIEAQQCPNGAAVARG